MKVAFSFAIAFALFMPLNSASADQASAWGAVESANQDADSVLETLDSTDSNYMYALGDTLDLAVQYVGGLVEAGKDRDSNIESLFDTAFTTMDSALQSDNNVAASLETVFGYLETAADDLELENYQLAEDAANDAAAELLNTQDWVDLYSTDLLQLDSDNTELSSAIQDWLGGCCMCCP